MFVKPSHQNFEKIYQRIYNRKFPAMQGMETVFIRLTNVIVSFYFLVFSSKILPFRVPNKKKSVYNKQWKQAFYRLAWKTRWNRQIERYG